MTARISGTDMSGSVTSDQGWKHMTLLGGAGVGRMTRREGLGAQGRAQAQVFAQEALRGESHGLPNSSGGLGSEERVVTGSWNKGVLLCSTGSAAVSLRPNSG